MFKSLTFLLFIISSFSFKAYAQIIAPLTDQFGRPITATKYNAVDGTPFLTDRWINGKAVADNGKVYGDLKLKYNTYDGVLSFIYLNSDEPQRFEEPIKTFTLFTSPQMLFVNGYPKIDRQTINSYYQLLADGKAQLLKRYFKNIKENRNYSLAQTDGVYSAGVLYYAYKGGKIIHLKNNKETMLALMSDKSAQINDYLAKNDLDFKSDDDLKKLFDYYNAL
jgi:hypothetical protein